MGIKIWGISDSCDYYYSFALFEKVYEKVIETITKLVNQLPPNVKFNIIADSFFGGMATAKGFFFCLFVCFFFCKTFYY